MTSPNRRLHQNLKPKPKTKTGAPAVGDSFFLGEPDDEGIAASVKINDVKDNDVKDRKVSSMKTLVRSSSTKLYTRSGKYGNL